MTEYLTEQEQVELLKSWVKQYSLVIISGVLIAVIGISGWRFWQQRQLKIYQHASMVFDEMLTNRARHDEAATLVQAKKLFSHYSETPYGQFAALMLGRNAIANNNYPEAEKQFSWVLKNSDISSLRQIARLRLARLKIAENAPQEAITLLDKIDDKSFSGMIDEVKGDAYLSMKNTDSAKKWYQQALQELPNAEVMRPLLQMKLDNLVTNQ